MIQRGKGRKNSVTEKEYQYKMREARATDKESLMKVLQLNYQKSPSLEDFYLRLNESNIETYRRSGKVKGIIFNGKKFRFSRLGISEDSLDKNKQSKLRSDNLSALRRTKKITLER